METRCLKPGCRAFTLFELVVVIAMIAVIFIVVLPQARQTRWHRGPRWTCVNNLKEVGLSFRLWVADGDRYPMQVSTNQGGAMEYTATTDNFRVFLCLSNELTAPKVLACPADKQRRPAAAFGPGFGNTNVSYFVGLDAYEAQPEMLLAGDHNLTNGLAMQNGVLTLTTNQPLGWTRALHNENGNVALADGSVQQLSSALLKNAVANTGTNLNRLLFP